MAVVRTRVCPSMFPPTSITAPTSEMMPPNAATMAAVTPTRASRAARPAAREQHVDEEPDDDRRQAHARVEREGDRALALEAHEAQHRAQRDADQAGHEQRGPRHPQR